MMQPVALPRDNARCNELSMSSVGSVQGGTLVDVPALCSEFIMQVVGNLDRPLDIGHTSNGSRRILYMTGGSFSGPVLNGDVLPGGGDWVFVRPDGIAELDIRFALRTKAAQLIYVASEGFFDIDPAQRARIQQGESIDPSEYYFRTTLRFETSAADLRWLTRIVAVGVGVRTIFGMVTKVFAIR